MPKITTRDFIRWSIKAYLKSAKENLFGDMVGKTGVQLVVDLVAWLFGWLVGVLLFMSFGGLLGVLVFVLIVLIGGLVGGIFGMIQNESFDFIQIKAPYQRFYASMKVLYFSLLQHWHLRRLLHKKGALPLDLVDFLNEMCARNLLETDGATWRFRHRIIQDYFAEQWVEPGQGKLIEGETQNLFNSSKAWNNQPTNPPKHPVRNPHQSYARVHHGKISCRVFSSASWSG